MVKFPKIKIPRIKINQRVTRTITASIIVVFAILVPFIMYFAGVQTYSALNPTNSIFTPFYTQRPDYRVLNPVDNSELYHFIQGDIPQIDFDPNNEYPGISLTVSEPFLTDYSGTTIINETEAMTGASNIKEYRFVEAEGKFRILTGFTLGFDFAVRTHRNFELTNRYHTYLIDDLVGESWSGVDEIFKLDIDGNVNNALLPFGVLAAGVNADNIGWSDGKQTTWAIDNVGFEKSLIPNPLNQQKGSQYGPQDDGTAFDEGDYLSGSFGNKQVLVVPELQFNVLNNFLKYDYFKPVEDTGDSFHIFSESTKLGIVNVRQSIYKDAGEIIDMPTSFFVQPDADPIEEGDTTFTVNNLDDFDESDITAGVFFQYTPNSEREEQLLHEATVLGDNYLSTNITPSMISIDNFNLPTVAEMSPFVYIQPQTIVKRASFNGLAYGAIGKLGRVSERFININIPDIPYGIKIINWYAIGRILVDIAVLSENSIEFIPLNGEPIQVTDLQQYGISEFGLTPTGVFEGGILDTRSVFEQEMGFIFLIIGIIVAVLIIITIVPLLLGFKLFFGGRGGNGGADPVALIRELRGFSGGGKVGKTKKGE